MSTAPTAPTPSPSPPSSSSPESVSARTLPAAGRRATDRTAPGPRGHWLLGATEALTDPLGCFVRWPREYGDVCAFRVGHRRLVLLGGPAVIEEALQNKARSFRKGVFERTMAVAVPNGLLLSEGDFWKRQRRMMSPPFHHKAIAGYAEVMVEVAESISAGWGAGGLRDIYPDMVRLASNVVARCLFGSDLGAEAEALGQSVTMMMAEVRSRLERVVSPPVWLPTPANRRLRAGIRGIERVTYRLIAERRARPEPERRDLLSLLLAARDDDGAAMSDRQVRDEAITLLVAGFETTAVTLAAALWYLGRLPAVQARLQEEIAGVLGDRAPTAADLPALGYADRVVKEALRLFPPAYSVDRDVIEPVEIGGVLLQAGTTVIFAPWATHRDPRFWRQPEEFDPDRWQTPEVKALPRGVYFPFGLGPRICIGSAFATMEAVLVVTRLVQRWQLHSPNPLLPDPGFTLRPLPSPLELRPRGRAE